jgi:hypothetical protein
MWIVASCMKYITAKREHVHLPGIEHFGFFLLINSVLYICFPFWGGMEPSPLLLTGLLDWIGSDWTGLDYCNFP